MTDREKHLETQLALILGMALGMAHRLGDTKSLRLLLDCEYAREVAEKNPAGSLAELRLHEGFLTKKGTGN